MDTALCPCCPRGHNPLAGAAAWPIRPFYNEYRVPAFTCRPVACPERHPARPAVIQEAPREPQKENGAGGYPAPSVPGPTGRSQRNDSISSGDRLSAVPVIFLRRAYIEDLLCNEARILTDGSFDLVRHVRILLEELLGILAALPDALAAIGEPRPCLLHDPGLHAEINQFACLGDTLAIHDVEFDLLEGRRDLVLHHLHAGLVAHHFLALLDRA